MKYTLCFLAAISLFLASCKDKLIIGANQSRSFEKFYGNIFQNNGNDIKTIPVSAAFPNGGYAAAGYTYKDSAGVKTDKDILFMILDRFGNLVGKPKLFGGLKDDEAKRVDVLSGGSGFILTGYTTIGSQKHAYIVRLNSAGTDTLWTWTSNIAGSTAEEAVSLYIDSVAKIYTVVGYQTIVSEKIGWIFNIDDNGKYDINNSNTEFIGSVGDTVRSFIGPDVQFTDVALGGTNKFCIYGSITAPATTSSPLNTANFFAASKASNFGFSSYRNENSGLDTSAYPRQMIILPDYSAAFLSSVDIINASTHQTHSVELSIFNKPEKPASSSLLSKWFFFDAAGISNGSSIDAVKMRYIQAENAFIIVANLTPANSTTNTSIVLFKVDGTNGNEIWRQNFGINQNYNASGLDITPDGGYIISGYNNSTGYNQSVLIIKTNKDGMLE